MFLKKSPQRAFIYPLPSSFFSKILFHLPLARHLNHNFLSPNHNEKKKFQALFFEAFSMSPTHNKHRYCPPKQQNMLVRRTESGGTDAPTIITDRMRTTRALGNRRAIRLGALVGQALALAGLVVKDRSLPAGALGNGRTIRLGALVGHALALAGLVIPDCVLLAGALGDGGTILDAGIDVGETFASAAVPGDVDDMLVVRARGELGAIGSGGSAGGGGVVVAFALAAVPGDVDGVLGFGALDDGGAVGLAGTGGGDVKEAPTSAAVPGSVDNVLAVGAPGDEGAAGSGGIVGGGVVEALAFAAVFTDVDGVLVGGTFGDGSAFDRAGSDGVNVGAFFKAGAVVVAFELELVGTAEASVVDLLGVTTRRTPEAFLAIDGGALEDLYITLR